MKTSSAVSRTAFSFVTDHFSWSSLKTRERERSKIHHQQWTDVDGWNIGEREKERKKVIWSIRRRKVRFCSSYVIDEDRKQIDSTSYWRLTREQRNWFVASPKYSASFSSSPGKRMRERDSAGLWQDLSWKTGSFPRQTDRQTDGRVDKAWNKLLQWETLK